MIQLTKNAKKLVKKLKITDYKKYPLIKYAQPLIKNAKKLVKKLKITDYKKYPLIKYAKIGQKISFPNSGGDC